MFMSGEDVRKKTNQKILDTLNEIKELLTPKPAPPSPPPVKKTFSEEFMDFQQVRCDRPSHRLHNRRRRG